MPESTDETTHVLLGPVESIRVSHSMQVDFLIDRPVSDLFIRSSVDLEHPLKPHLIDTELQLIRPLPMLIAELDRLLHDIV